MQKFLHYVPDNVRVNSAGEVNVILAFFSANPLCLYFYIFFISWVILTVRYGRFQPNKALVQNQKYLGSTLPKKLAERERAFPN